MGDELDYEPMLGVLFSFWSAVKEVFAGEWGLPPKKCRLLHGAGVVCLGLMMDAIPRSLSIEGSAYDGTVRSRPHCGSPGLPMVGRALGFRSRTAAEVE
jgi:hypothetical protein